MLKFQSLLTPVVLEPAHVIARVVHGSVLTRLGFAELPLPQYTAENGVMSWKYVGQDGYLQYDYDGIRIVIEVFQHGRKMLRCAMRDRQLDGTKKISPLTSFPNSDRACNRLPLGVHGAELSIYSYDTDGTGGLGYLPDIDQPGTMGHFIANPDSYVWAQPFNAKEFFPLWESAFFSGRAPWQLALPMSGVPRHFVTEACQLLQELGYHFVDNVVSWYNVARFFCGLGFDFTYGEHKLTYQALTNDLKTYRGLTPSQQSWLVVLQSIRDVCALPEDLLLPCGARWPVTHAPNENSRWARMHRVLNPYHYLLPVHTPSPSIITRLGRRGPYKPAEESACI